MGKQVIFTAFVVCVFLLTIGCSQERVSVKKAGKSAVWSFDQARKSSLPDGWVVAETQTNSTPAQWQVIHDDTAVTGTQVVAIVENNNPNRTFNLLIAEDTNYRDLSIKVMVKAIEGKIDQGGGPIWRAGNSDNYYIARWNPLEDNFRVYTVKDGKRKQLASADVKIDPKAWHEIQIDHIGDHITAFLDGEKMLELEDSTFREAGHIGLWVKADGKTAFDNVVVIDKGEMNFIKETPIMSGHAKPFNAKKFVQIGLVVGDVETYAKNYAAFFGVDVPKINTSETEDKAKTRYDGKPTKARVKMAFFHFDNITLELLEPVGGPSTWRDFLDEKGDGVHHIAFEVKGMDDQITAMQDRGASLIQQGQWTGGAGGRYAYLDSTAQLAVILELLENF